MNLKRNFDLIHFLWKRTFHLANRLPWWHAGSDACTHNKLHECGWEVGIMMADPDIKSFGAISAKIQLRELFVIKCRNSHSHQFICTQSHLATSVSITMATHCYSLRSPEAIRRCPLSFPPPFSSSISSSDIVILLHFSPQSLSPLPLPSQRCSSSSGGRHTAMVNNKKADRWD